MKKQENQSEQDHVRTMHANRKPSKAQLEEIQAAATYGEQLALIEQAGIARFRMSGTCRTNRVSA